jgi:hypothetical protein
MSDKRKAKSQTAAKVILSDFASQNRIEGCIEAQTKGTAQKD